MFFKEEYEPRHRAAEGRLISRGFALLAENAHDLGFTDDWGQERFPTWADAPNLAGYPDSTPWKKVIHPRYAAEV